MPLALCIAVLNHQADNLSENTALNNGGGVYLLNNNTTNTVTVTFDSVFTEAIVFVDGQRELVNLKSGVYTTELEAGEGVFVIPLKIEQ